MGCKVGTAPPWPAPFTRIGFLDLTPPAPRPDQGRGAWGTQAITEFPLPDPGRGLGG
jgi:hypothetical protein